METVWRLSKTQPIALESLYPLFRREQRLQIEPDDLVAQHARIGVAAEQWDRLSLGVTLARQIGVREQRLEDWRERALPRTFDDGQHLRRRPAIVDVGICQHKR